MGIRAVVSATVLAASIGLVGVAALSGCSTDPAGSAAAADPADPVELLESFGIAAPAAAGTDLAGSGPADAAAIVEVLDALPVAERPADLSTSITATELRLQPDTSDEASIALTGDRFYLSVAPYREQTHPCRFHSPTSCLGELRGAPVEIRVTEAASGEVVLERSTETADNGFVGLWLPRDGEYSIEVVADGDRGVQTVRTGDGDPTCITTLRLTSA